MRQWEEGKQHLNTVTRMMTYSSQIPKYTNVVDLKALASNKSRSEFLTIEGIQQLRKVMEQAMIDFPAEIGYLTEVIASYSRLRDRLAMTMNTHSNHSPTEKKKFHLSVVRNTLYQLIALPLSYADTREDSTLLNIIEASQVITNDVHKAKDYMQKFLPEKFDYRIAQTLLSRYKTIFSL